MGTQVQLQHQLSNMLEMLQRSAVQSYSTVSLYRHAHSPTCCAACALWCQSAPTHLCCKRRSGYALHLAEDSRTGRDERDLTTLLYALDSRHVGVNLGVVKHEIAALKSAWRYVLL